MRLYLTATAFFLSLGTCFSITKLGGYGGGLHRKKWLIDHEKKRVL